MAVSSSPANAHQIPIAVLSFNRPHYLVQVLDSLARQTALDDHPVFLFQDGAVSHYSGVRHCRDEDIAACVELFRARFPKGQAFVAPHNLGVARNFLRAEAFVFQSLEADIAYFLEDDMVLSAHYLAMMSRMAAFAQADERIGYFSVYGALGLPLDEQGANLHLLRRLSYNWAFGLTRHHWSELRTWLEPYYRICSRHDYAGRNHKAILRHYWAQGIPLIGTSQDIMKRLGTYALGRIGINTVPCFGRYIGEEGLHFNREKFRNDGLADTPMFPSLVGLSLPSPQEIDALHAEEMQERRDVFERYLAQRKARADAAAAAAGRWKPLKSLARRGRRLICGPSHAGR